MSRMISPVGPESPVVYWVRRGAVVLLVLTVLVGLWWAFAGGSNEDPGASPTPHASASATPTASTTAQPTPASTASQAPSGLCPDANIGVTSSTDSSTYKVGSTPNLTLTIENIGSFACTRDVGPKANALIITSGGYPVWSSDDCNADDNSKEVVLEPGDRRAASITWNGRKTPKTCGNQGALAKAGSYDVTGRNGLVESPKTPFALTNKR